MINQDTIKESISTVFSSLNLPNIISALIVFVIFLLIGRLLKKLLNRALNRTKMEASTKNVINRIGKILFGIITALAVFSELGFDTSSTIAIISVLSLGLALAVNDILSDVAGGFVMISTKPFWIGDYIACEDIEGTVEVIHLNHTKLRTVDGVLITVPNRILASSKVKNYSVYGRRRLSITACTSYDVPAEKTTRVLMDLMKSYDTVLQDPAPLVYLTGYQASNLEYTMYCWVKSADFLKTKWKMTQQILEVFNENGIEISYNHLKVHVIDPENVIRVKHEGEAPAAGENAVAAAVTAAEEDKEAALPTETDENTQKTT